MKRTENRFVLILEETDQAMRKNYRKEIEKLEENGKNDFVRIGKYGVKGCFFQYVHTNMGFFTSTLLMSLIFSSQ